MDAAAETFRRSILAASTALFGLAAGRRGVDLSAFDSLNEGGRRLAAEKAARALAADGTVARRDSLAGWNAAAVLRLVPRSRLALAA